MYFSYNDTKELAEKFSDKFPFADISVIGKTVCKRNIYSLSIGSGEPCVLFVGDSADRSGISAQLLIKFFERLCIAYKNDLKISAVKVRSILREQKIVIVPSVNPDCPEICHSDGENAACYKGLVKKAACEDYKKWISNARGVELDKNFPYNFSEYCKKGLPSPFGWCGPSAASENETKSLMYLCDSLKPKHAVTVSPVGRKITCVCQSKQSDCAMMTQVFKSVCGLRVAKKSEATLCGSFDGWFSRRFDAPAFTFCLNADNGAEPEIIYSQAEELLILSAVM